MVFREKIEIILGLINNFSSPVKKVSQSLSQLELQTQAYQNVAANANIPVRAASKYMRNNSLVMQDASTAVSTLTGRTYALGQVAENAKRQHGRFKMELLGVMFAGMALWRVTSGLIKAQFELFGITEMFGNMMTVLFLPVMTSIAPILYSIMEWFMNLPDPVKKAIGVFIMILAVLGGFLMIFGQIGLGITSVTKAFTFLGGISAAVVAGIVLIIAGVYFVISGIIDIVKNWGKVWHKVVKGISKVLLGLALIIGGIALIIGSVPIAIAAAAILIIAGIAWVVSKIIEHWDKVVAFVKMVVNKIVGFFKWLWDKLVGHSIIPDMINAIIKWFMKFPESVYKGVMYIITTIYTLGRIMANYLRNVFSNVWGWFKYYLYDRPIAYLKSLIDWISDVWSRIKGLFGFGGGSVSVDIPSRQSGGIVPTTGPYLLHKGEYVSPKHKSGGGGEGGDVIINQTNYVNVSDKEEMEKLIRNNNVKLVEEIKRQVSI